VKNIISMSLYGTDPMYLNGAITNARLTPEVFPGWTMRVYYDRHDIDPAPLIELGCEVVARPHSRRHSGMFWRFLAAWDDDVERVIMRDSDSRLNVREAAAVLAWEESGLDAHCMMDHPNHKHLPISGGMWGILGGVLPQSVKDDVELFGTQRQQRVTDMRWLRDHVQPLIEGSLLRHSSVETKWPHEPWPDAPPYDGFVGQQHRADGSPIWPARG